MNQATLQPIFDKLNHRFAADLQLTPKRLQTTIRNAVGFRNIFNNGYKIVTREAIFFFFADPKLQIQQETEYGIIASKTVGGAVERNRCKRLLRETFRHTLARADNPLQGIKIVAVARKACVAADLNRVLTSLIWAINRNDDHSRSTR